MIYWIVAESTLIISTYRGKLTWAKAPAEALVKDVRVIVIRRVGEGDANALVEFYNGLSPRSIRTFRPLGKTTTRDVCQDIVQDNVLDVEKCDFVVVDEDRIIGWSFVWGLASEEPTLGLCVADAHQGQGLGRTLLDRALVAARERELARVHLTVVKDNSVALRLYESRGFVRCGEFVGSDGLDYYRMQVDIIPSHGTYQDENAAHRA